MKRTKNLALFLLVSVLTAGTLGGCQKPSGGTDAQDAEVQADTGAAAGDKKDTLRVALTAEPPSLTTCDHDSLISVGLNMLTYNGLVRIDNATLKPVLDLASDYNANWLENIYYLSNQRRLFMKCSDKVKTILIEGKLQ